VADTKAKDVKDNDDELERAKAAASDAPTPRVMVVPGNDLRGYIGVSPEYMNYANETDKPIITEDEAYLYTDMDQEAVEATRQQPSGDGLEVADNWAPAVAEDTLTGAVVPPRRRDEEPDEDEVDPYAPGPQDEGPREQMTVDRSEPGVVRPVAAEPAEKTNPPAKKATKAAERPQIS
jgi:hypothetical protein